MCRFLWYLKTTCFTASATQNLKFTLCASHTSCPSLVCVLLLLWGILGRWNAASPLGLIKSAKASYQNRCHHGVGSLSLTLFHLVSTNQCVKEKVLTVLTGAALQPSTVHHLHTENNERNDGETTWQLIVKMYWLSFDCRAWSQHVGCVSLNMVYCSVKGTTEFYPLEGEHPSSTQLRLKWKAAIGLAWPDL